MDRPAKGSGKGSRRDRRPQRDASNDSGVSPSVKGMLKTHIGVNWQPGYSLHFLALLSRHGDEQGLSAMPES